MTPEEAELLNALRRYVHSFGAHAPSRDADVLAAIQHTQHQILERLQAMSDAFDTELSALRSDVAAQSSVIASATTAFQGLAAQIAAAEAAAKNAGATPDQIAAVTAVRTGLEANTAALAAAIPANTPAQSPTPPAAA